MSDDQSLTVTGPDGKSYQFPQDATDDEIKSFFAKQSSATAQIASTQAQKPPAKTTPEDWADKLKDIALAATGPLGTLATKAAKPIRDFVSAHPVATAANVAGAVVDLASGGATLPEHIALAGGVPAVVAGVTQGVKDVTQGKIPGQDMAKAAVTEGMPQAFNPLGGKLIDATARGVMTIAQGASAKLAAEFPELAQTAIDNAIAVSKGGLDKARQLLKQAKSAASASLNQAAQAGKSVPISAATDGLQDTLASHVQDSADIPGGLKVLSDIENEIKAGRSATMTPVEADALLRDLQRRAKAVYAARNSGANPALASLQSQAYADAAKNLRQAIGEVSPGYLDANGEAQQMIGQMKAVRTGATKNTIGKIMLRTAAGAGTGGAIGYGTGGRDDALYGALTGLALTPGNLSRLSILLANPAMRATLSRLPSNTLAALLNAGGSQ